MSRVTQLHRRSRKPGPGIYSESNTGRHRAGVAATVPKWLPGAVVLDCGSAYASKSFTDQQGRRISWSWLPDYGGPATPQTLVYNGTLTLPRVLSLEKGELRSPVPPGVERTTDGQGQPSPE